MTAFTRCLSTPFALECSSINVSNLVERLPDRGRVVLIVPVVLTANVFAEGSFGWSDST